VYWCCVLGNEGNGISSKVINACKYRIRIGMSETVDSLSVGVAGGILLHNIREREATSSNNDD
jgi:tRNA G18 (ribose-2'-O)-methylase SpoU